ASGRPRRVARIVGRAPGDVRPRAHSAPCCRCRRSLHRRGASTWHTSPRDRHGSPAAGRRQDARTAGGDGPSCHLHDVTELASRGLDKQPAKRHPLRRPRRLARRPFAAAYNHLHHAQARRGARGKSTMGKHMGNGWKKAGLIGLGTVLGVLLSLNFSVFAQRDAKLPIPYEDLQLLSAVFGRIKSDYVEPVSDDKLIHGAINGMVHDLDPHSDFLDADAFKELQVATQGKFGGLGIEVGIEDGVVRVVSPIEDTPAFKAGIKSGDLIVKIDDTATRGMPLSKAVEKMRGAPGSPVVLTVVRKEVDTPLTFTILRQEINVKSVRAKMLEPGYGYIRVRSFQERTGDDLARAIKDFYKQGDLKGLVLDLRSDPGGLLNQAVAVSAAFLPKDALVVYTDGRTPDAKMHLTASRENYQRRGDDMFRD